MSQEVVSADHPIVIIGAGFAGLACATVLHKERLHCYCRLECGVKTLIPTRFSRSPPRRRIRHCMWSHLHQCTNYRQRWQAETTMSMIKRRTGSALEGRNHYARRRLALLKALTHNIMILHAQQRVTQVFYKATRGYSSIGRSNGKTAP